MSERHVLIIGGGLSGLSTGCYARASGFRTTIVEHSLALGGVCTAWSRGPYTIDGCIQWLTGGAFDRIYEELESVNNGFFAPRSRLHRPSDEQGPVCRACRLMPTRCYPSKTTAFAAPTTRTSSSQISEASAIHHHRRSHHPLRRGAWDLAVVCDHLRSQRAKANPSRGTGSASLCRISARSCRPGRRSQSACRRRGLGGGA